MSATVGIANWGPLVIGSDVDDALISTLRTWMPTYLRRIHDDRSMTFMPALPRSYTNAFEAQEFLDNQLPAIVVTTVSLQATLGGANYPYQGAWTALVACVVRGKRPAATRFLAHLYTGIVQQVVLQQARGGALANVHLMSARPFPVPDATGQGRYLLAGESTFSVKTDEIVQAFDGPDVPDADTYLDEATVVEVDIEVLGDEVIYTGG